MTVDNKDEILARRAELAPEIGQLVDKASDLLSEISSSQVLENNLAVLGNLDLRTRISKVSTDSVSVKVTQDGPVLWKEGLCLDHPTKPVSAAASWFQRSIVTSELKNYKRILIAGFGSGYHIETIVNELDKSGESAKKVICLEPDLAVIRAAFETRDLTAILPKIELCTDVDNLELDRDTFLIARAPSATLFPELIRKAKSAIVSKRGISDLKPSIAVVGPFHGGTLPIMGYTTLGLKALGQRVRDVDMSGYDASYNFISNVVQDPIRKNNVEKMFYETVSQSVLETVQEKPVDILICMALAPVSPRILQECRSKGITTVLWFVEDFHRFTYWKDVAQYFDFVFTIQKEPAISAIKAAGAGEVIYLPVGCDPGIHRPLALSEEDKKRYGSPISFVGAGYYNRQQMFASLADMPFKIWGSEWPDCRPFDRMVQEGARRLTPAEYVKIFSSTEININLHSSSERDGIDPFGDFLNPRTFELAACGAFQLVDNRQLLAEHFEIGKEIITFENTRDLKEKIAYYLAHPEERRKIAEAGRARVLKDHTYAQRINAMLEQIYVSRFDAIKERIEQGPWSKMIKRASSHKELSARCEKAFLRGEQPNLDGLVSDIITGKGALSDTEMKLLFLFHLRKQIIRMRQEELGVSNQAKG